MRLIATAVACVLAAFGAAFLIGRAANHQGSATAATTQPRTVAARTSTRSSTVATITHPNKALAAQFQPGLRGLRRKPKVHRRVRHVTASRSSSAPAAPATTPSYTPPASTYTAPAYTAPAYTAPAKPAPTHKSGGSGTTTIG